MGFGSWIRGKAIVTILAAVFLYFVGASFNLVPTPVQGFVAWMDRNTDPLLFAVCFLAGCYVVVRIRRKKEQEE